MSRGPRGISMYNFRSFHTRERSGIRRKEMLIDCIAQVMDNLVIIRCMGRTQRLQNFAKTVKLILYQEIFLKPNLEGRPITWKLINSPSNSGKPFANPQIL